MSNNTTLVNLNETENEGLIIFEESSRDYRTEIPNIVFELLSFQKISYFAFVLYCVYRRTAGENGHSWKGFRKLSEECGFSLHKISDARKELQKTFEEFDGKPLIIVQKGDIKKNQTDTVFIVDVWKYNHKTFLKKKVERSQAEHPRSRQEHPRSPQEYKKEHIKKEPYKKTTTQEVKDSVPVVVPKIFPFLENLKLTLEEKQALSSKYHDRAELLQKGIAYCTKATFKVRTTLIGCIMHFCDHPEHMVPDQKDLVSQKLKEEDEKRERACNNFSLMTRFFNVHWKYIMTDLRNMGIYLYAGNEYLEIKTEKSSTLHNYNYQDGKIYYHDTKFNELVSLVLKQHNLNWSYS